MNDSIEIIKENISILIQVLTSQKKDLMPINPDFVISQLQIINSKLKKIMLTDLKNEEKSKKRK